MELELGDRVPGSLRRQLTLENFNMTELRRLGVTKVRILSGANWISPVDQGSFAASSTPAFDVLLEDATGNNIPFPGGGHCFIRLDDEEWRLTAREPEVDF